MKHIYLAGRYDRRRELLGRSLELEAVGWRSTSRWLTGAHEGSTDPRTLARCAAEDLEDIVVADAFLAFSETPDVGFTSGGRHVELGFALALIGEARLGMRGEFRVLLVGPVENVFHHLPQVERFETWPEALRALQLTGRRDDADRCGLCGLPDADNPEHAAALAKTGGPYEGHVFRRRS